MNAGVGGLWVYLSTSPLLGLTLTLLAYLGADRVWRRLGQPALLQPVLVAIVAIVLLLRLTNTPYERYFDGAQFVHFLLGPATVALAIPLYRNLKLIREDAAAVLVALLAGSITSIVAGILIAQVLGAPEILVRSIAPKSVTAPIAMAMSEKIGGIPSLTAALTILTGITGAVLATIVFRERPPDWAARGLGIGTASHGIGTARAIALDSVAGAFSTVALGANAILTSLLVPLVAAVLMR
ncbi:MAG: LrgB family protein [Candidatus Velthaea sp.]|jgi:predicted murein hydrolase (TIGR00659 family)